MPTDAQLTQLMRDFQRIKEKVEVLNANRGGSGYPRAGVRREDFNAIAALAKTMQSAQVTSAPTATDFNALQKDVAALYGALVQVSNILGNRTD